MDETGQTEVTQRSGGGQVSIGRSVGSGQSGQSVVPARRVSAAARLLLILVVARESDLVGELIVQLHLGLLGQRVLGDRLERLLHVDGLLSARLEVGDLVFAMAPLLRPLGRHL